MKKELVGVLIIIAFISGVIVGVYVSGGSRLIAVSLSPDGTKQVEFYTPSRWHTLFLHQPDMAVFLRMTRVIDSEPLADSAVTYLGGSGEVIWTKDGALVGVSAIFDEKSGHWTVLH